jgi:hypothetical protein
MFEKGKRKARMKAFDQIRKRKGRHRLKEKKKRETE